jgi:DeoR/GlpR family transcriptional regulator of sugar metabolism
VQEKELPLDSTPDERRNFILTELQAKRRVTTADLATQFSLWEDTAGRNFRSWRPTV